MESSQPSLEVALAKIQLLDALVDESDLSHLRQEQLLYDRSDKIPIPV